MPCCIKDISRTYFTTSLTISCGTGGPIPGTGGKLTSLYPSKSLPSELAVNVPPVWDITSLTEGSRVIPIVSAVTVDFVFVDIY